MPVTENEHSRGSSTTLHRVYMTQQKHALQFIVIVRTPVQSVYKQQFEVNY
jgi:hypothetical protein